jgi:Na+-transporting methylmalonyl-CoA/oxaloacetate decarboxylase gamma subunit
MLRQPPTCAEKATRGLGRRLLKDGFMTWLDATGIGVGEVALRLLTELQISDPESPLLPLRILSALLAMHVAQKAALIAATGLLIVFAALLLIALFIAALPRILTYVADWFPERQHKPSADDPSKSLLPDEAVLAAIGFVLHTEVQKQMESRRQ